MYNNYRSGYHGQSHIYDASPGDYFREADNSDGVKSGHHRHYPGQYLTSPCPVTTAQQLAAVGMSQTGYSGSPGGGGSMQSTPTPQQQQQSMPPPPSHAPVGYHQQPGPPYVIGPGPSPGQYNNRAQLTYRQPQAPYQHQPQQQQQQPARPTFIGNNSTNLPSRLSTTPRHQSAPYLVQQPQQNTSPIRMSQQGQQAGQQHVYIGQHQPARGQGMAGHHQQHLIMGGTTVQQPHMIRIQSPSQQQMGHQGSPRMVGQGQPVATSTSSGLMMPSQYTGQGSYPRQVVVSQQPIIVQQSQPQQSQVQYQYKQQQPQPQQQIISSQLQQPPSQLQQQVQPVLPKQPAPSPSSVSSSAPSTPASQFATPGRMDTPAGLTSSPSAAAMSAVSTGTSGSAMISDGVTGGAVAAQSDSSQVLTKQRLDDLVREVDPYEQLDDDVKDALLQIADEFIESVVSGACQVAKHRKATTVDVKDVQLCLERNWNMWIPGFGTEEIRPYKKACVTEAHKQRMAVIKKTLKKI